MKVFWILIALFLAAAVGYLVIDPAASKSPTATERAPSPAPTPAPPLAAAPTPAPTPTPTPPPPAPAIATQEPSTPPTPTAIAEPVAQVPTPTENSEEQGYVEPRKADAAGAPEVIAEAAPANARPEADNSGPYAVAEGEIVKQEDGSLRIDGRFTVKGDGSAQSPFEIPWELITSAEESYEPRAGKLKIPQRVAMLDGKHIKINGYVAFPMYVQEPKELLAMLNQWDGCCIGVPPTPYDAIEVQLKQVVDERARLATSGAVQGVFKVKPYVVGDWLVGLYMMEDAAMTPEEYGGFGS